MKVSVRKLGVSSVMEDQPLLEFAHGSGLLHLIIEIDGRMFYIGYGRPHRQFQTDEKGALLSVNVPHGCLEVVPTAGNQIYIRNDQFEEKP